MDSQHLVQMYSLSESLVYYVNAIQSNGAVLALLRSHGQHPLAELARTQLSALEQVLASPAGRRDA